MSLSEQLPWVFHVTLTEAGILKPTSASDLFAQDVMNTPAGEALRQLAKKIGPGEQHVKTLDTRSANGASGISRLELSLTRLQGNNFIAVVNALDFPCQDVCRKLSFEDPLTGAGNKRSAYAHLRDTSQATHLTSCLAVIDLDGFKQVNDMCGHLAGDTVLKEAARRLTQASNHTGTLHRIGGDEFLIIAPDISTEEQAAEFGKRIVESLQAPYKLRHRHVRVSASVGLAIRASLQEHPDDWLHRADMAMYHAKQQGKNRAVVFDTYLETEQREAFLLEQELHDALTRKELYLKYQPIFDPVTRCPVSVEALMRWQNRLLGDCSPAKFIPVAERTGLIRDLGFWAVLECCKQLKTWEAQGCYVPNVSVNISPVQVDEHFAVNILQILEAEQVSGNRLTLEITEGILIDGSKNFELQLAQLSARGVRIAVDDFGTGFSSLSYLQRLALTTLKIDRSFVSQMLHSKKSEALINGMLDIAKALGLTVVAEGVETEEQNQLLIDKGCHLAQGWFVAGAQMPEDIIKLFASKKPPT